MTEMEAERYFFEKAVILWAGPVAEARARRGSEPGWVRWLSPERSRAIHESAHGITAAALGQFVHRLSIVPNPERCFPGGHSYSGGFCVCSDREDDDRPVSSRPMRDRSQIALAGWALTHWNVPCRWKSVLATVRMLRQAAEKILDAHWRLILSLASELERRKDMGRSEIEHFTERVRATVTDAKIPLGGDSLNPRGRLSTARESRQ